MSRLQKIGYQNCSFQHTGVFANIDPEGTNVVTLAERAGISKQAMSKLVKDIEELGFVETRKDPKDSRAILVQLNEKGTQFIIDVYNCIDDIRNELENVVGKENFDSFMGTAVLLNNYFDNKQQNSTNRDNFSLYPPLK
ncbi:MarR family winged helix-turn-helix transcriptional regulator [Solitalea koreensis]|nr:MarR family winged helix-turn-helix transcriptional regulator [Solitalea koreensis]